MILYRFAALAACCALAAFPAVASSFSEADLARLDALGLKVAGKAPANDTVGRITAPFIPSNASKILTDADCALIARLPAAQSLTLGGAPASAACLGAIATMPRLASLNLARGEVGDAALAALAPLTNLEVLILSGAKGMTDAGLAAALGKLSGLKSVHLETKSAGDATAQALAALPRLERVDMSGSSITDAGLGGLAGSASVTHLTLRSTALTDAGLAALAAGKARPVSLILSHGKGVTAAGVAHLAKLGELASLDLWNVKVGGGLAPLAGLTKLRELIISGAGATDEDLAALVRLYALRRLVAYDNPGITDAGMKALGSMAGLEEVVLTKTAVTDAGLPALAGMAGLKRLTLAETAVSDAGLAALLPLKLQTLDLRKTKVTEAAFATLTKMTTLTSLNMMQNGIGEQAVARAKEALPKAHIAR